MNKGLVRRPIGAGLASLGKQPIIEGVIGQLKDFLSLERHRARTLGGLPTRLAAKVVAYTPAHNASTTPSADRCVI